MKHRIIIVRLQLKLVAAHQLKSRVFKTPQSTRQKGGGVMIVQLYTARTVSNSTFSIKRKLTGSMINAKVSSTIHRRNLKKRSFISTDRPTIHTNLSRKRSFSKTLFKPEEFENAALRTENILKTELFEAMTSR